MPAKGSSGSSEIRFARWAGRILDVLLVVLFIVFAVGEGLPSASQIVSLEKLGFVAVGIMLVGAVAAWRWDGLGGLLMLIGYGIFAFLNGKLVVGLFTLFVLAGVLHLYVWWRAKEPARR